MKRKNKFELRFTMAGGKKFTMSSTPQTLEALQEAYFKFFNKTNSLSLVDAGGTGIINMCNIVLIEPIVNGRVIKCEEPKK